MNFLEFKYSDQLNIIYLKTITKNAFYIEVG